MNTYSVSWSQTEYRTAMVDADSEEAAIELVRTGQYDDSDFDMAEGFELVEVVEHDSYDEERS